MQEIMASENHLPDAIIFPFMAQGHTLSLLDLAKILSQRGLKVTIISTPSNAKQTSSILSTKFPNISIHVIPFPICDDLSQDCENTKDIISKDQHLSFLRATLKLKEPFESFLREKVEKTCHSNSNSNIFVVCDLFLCWAIPICSSLNIPGILFTGMGVLSSAIWRLMLSNEECIKSLSNGEELETLPGLASPFFLTRNDFGHWFDDNHPTMQFLFEIGDVSSSCWGVLSNSFEEIEGKYIGALESTYDEGVKVWCVGPLLLYDQAQIHVNTSMEECNKDSCNYYQRWLDEQIEKLESVIYVSFGTQAYVSDIQMDEIALGLEMAGYPFVCVVRSTSWKLPEGWEERVKSKGMIIREWVDQRSILSHPSVGGFLSHCGWNSVLESLGRGVPLLTWPMGAEQPLNAKFVVQVLKAGIAINTTKVVEQGSMESAIVGRNDISRGVEELMGGENGRVARERAKEIGMMSRKAVAKDGSSSKKLDEFISCLVELKK
ncbi:UDP-glycosyltransferase 73C3 [Beta vulgaris subsp. vulgaris]|uniref:UDP-glycosyltransferase 73C3 n=1 Tax=Beta vulgaris subsp. vulgaris TaxID=3555 RepID=UPI002036E7DF|nr:UDP-glycosyltransferase 73C3 [Beta vulgaris subsp. vulgaris]